jgi:transposase
MCVESQSIEVDVRARIGSKPVCSSCRHPGPTYDHLGVRRFEFVPFWGFMVFLRYRMRRVDCRRCGVKVEQVPWGCGKHQMTTAYVLFPGPLGQEIIMEGNRFVVSYVLGIC